MVALDMSKGFDTMKNSKLINGKGPRLVTTIYKADRLMWFPWFQIEIPKGKAGSSTRWSPCPLLFILYLRDIASHPEGVNLTSYADDCTILATRINISHRRWKNPLLSFQQESPLLRCLRSGPMNQSTTEHLSRRTASSISEKSKNSRCYVRPTVDIQ